MQVDKLNHDPANRPTASSMQSANINHGRLVPMISKSPKITHKDNLHNPVASQRLENCIIKYWDCFAYKVQKGRCRSRRKRTWRPISQQDRIANTASDHLSVLWGMEECCCVLYVVVC